MYILGINAYHADAAACLLRDGEIVAAAEEERFTRVKHCGGFPAHAIRWCLAQAGISLSDVDQAAINQDNRAHRWRKLCYVLTSRPHARLIGSRLRNRRSRVNVDRELNRMEGHGKFRGGVRHVEHHLAHLASASLVSPFAEAVVLSVDGFGDFASAAWGSSFDGRLRVDGRILFPHSLGIFYQALTQYLGFPDYGDEYKVMGLAPYGKPRFMAQMRCVVGLQDDGSYRLDLNYFSHHRQQVTYGWEADAAASRLYSPALEGLLGPSRESGATLEQKHSDIAASVQAMYEEAFFHLLNCLHARYGVPWLALAGGCAQNSVANGKIYSHTPFRRLYVQPAAGDAGGALGAALAVWDDIRPMRDGGARRQMTHSYWGPGCASEEIHRLLADRAEELERAGCGWTAIGEDELCRRVASEIASGRVVGWFQGRMEWGPRALGNRSLLGDPRRADMKDILNAKIKRRESFRPFAPSILREAVADWFEVDEDVPFMTQVYPIRRDKRARIPAVTHVDGTGRLQTVTRESNELYHRLITAFRDLTGIPILLNTSFNENEPIVCTPAEALDCFLRTRMDLLVLGEHLVFRADQAVARLGSEKRDLYRVITMT